MERIDHVGLAVADLDKALAFYERVFGLHSVHEEVNEEQGVREAMVDVAGSGSFLQLLAPLRRTPPSASSWRATGEGIQQLAFRVSGHRGGSQRLRDAGVRLLYDAAEARHGGLAGQLHPSQGLWWGAGRAGRAGALRPHCGPRAAERATGQVRHAGPVPGRRQVTRE